ncbi:glycosyltransferase family 39 protein [Bryobacter aggregatus]|uniref:glycosyltransferase family 39 protein n=1 Tax=Bryobacter aggregatus TaxID=360054 RepID=UPI00138E2C6A|nr:glycosyltransferase family 39 protein [Bryobacter aggregatus]
MNRFLEFVATLDRNPRWALLFCLAVFAMVMIPAALRPLWYDELVTYYIAMSPSWDRFLESVQTVDLQPPLNFLLVRISILLLGDSDFSARVPSLLAFVAASLVVFQLVRHRLGGLFGLMGMAVFWCVWLVYFAVEARPYALMLALLCCGLYCWLAAIERPRWSRWHTGLTVSLAALFLTHCFAPLFGSAIGVGELVRSVERRRLDRRIWLAILLPLLILPLYFPLLRTAHSMRFSPALESTMALLSTFYYSLVMILLPVVGIVVVLGYAVRDSGKPWCKIIRSHELAFCLTTLAMPALVGVYCMISGIQFVGRYGIGAMLGVTLLVVAILARLLRNPGTVLLITVLLVGLFVWSKGLTGMQMGRYRNVSLQYREIEPNLPFITANGMTFLEMDRREPTQLAARLFYLTNNEAALHYIKSNMFEGLVHVQRLFPIRGQVVSYEQFLATHRRFLVFAMPSDHENWLLPKLKDDGATISLRMEAEQTGYLDRHVYEVVLPGPVATINGN